MSAAGLRGVPAEVERAAYRRHVVCTIQRSGVPLSDPAALVASVLAATPQAIMSAPLSPHARAHFDVHAEDAGAPVLSREGIAAALDELAARGLLPLWCDPARFDAEGVAR